MSVTKKYLLRINQFTDPLIVDFETEYPLYSSIMFTTSLCTFFVFMCVRSNLAMDINNQTTRPPEVDKSDTEAINSILKSNLNH